MEITTLKTRPAQARKADTAAPCEAAAILRKLADLQRRKAALPDDDDGSAAWNALNDQMQALLLLAAYSKPVSPAGYTLLTLVNVLMADTWDDFTEAPQMPQALIEQDNKRRAARIEMAYLMFCRARAAYTDADLDLLCEYYLPNPDRVMAA